MTATSRPLAGLLIALPLALGACSGIRTPLDGLFAAPPAPDAFAVLSRAPLRMPPDTTLPEPRPGEVSPLEPTPLVDAQVALLGRPVDRATATAPSPGELALLEASGSAAADPNIRAALAAEESGEDPDAPYKPPTIFMLLFGEELFPSEDVIDASAEARRLAGEGIVTPTDPNAVPPEPAE